MKMIKIKEYHAKLVEGVKQVMESESFKDFITFSSKFRRYSFGNTLLIWSQRKGVTHVAGMKTWNSLGRHIKKGEKGIAIFAPVIKKVKENTTRMNTKSNLEVAETEVERLIGFRAVYVFDVEQTDGKSVPEIETEMPVMDGDAQDLFDRIFRASPVPVDYEDIEGEARGYYKPKEQQIVLSSRLTVEEQCKTLLHELAHHLAINGQNDKELEKHDRLTGEVIAEGVAFITSAHFGLNSSGYSFPYIASWSEEVERVLLAGNTIRKIGFQLIEMIERVEATTLPAAVPDIPW